MLCQTEKMLEHEVETAHLAKREGLDVVELNVKELKDLEPKRTAKCHWCRIF